MSENVSEQKTQGEDRPINPRTGKPYSRDRMRQLRYIAEGRCPLCGVKPNDRPGMRCTNCLAANAKAERERKGMQPWHKGGRGRPPKVLPAAAESTAQHQPAASDSPSSNG